MVKEAFNMSPLFGKKVRSQAMAEVLENGRDIFNQEMLRNKYRHYAGAEPILQIAVRVQPENEIPFEAGMQTGISTAFLLLPGVRVLVEYDLGKKDQVRILDDSTTILERNPQLKKS
jgi:hypothetical protein